MHLKTAIVLVIHTTFICFYLHALNYWMENLPCKLMQMLKEPHRSVSSLLQTQVPTMTAAIIQI